MKCKIYDTTLRDGEQMPGVVFSPFEKRSLVEKFSSVGVDYIGLMPAISSEEQKLAYELCSSGFSNKMIAATMMRREHIDLAKKLGFENIILFTSVSDVHLEKKLRMSRDENLKKTLEYISYANDLGLNVHFAGEDSSRADENYLLNFVSSISKEIKEFMYCDTLGVLNCMNTYEKIRNLVDNVNCDIGLHMHNDFGQAVSNSLLGVVAGAKIVSGTFTGIGERAGNAALEEVVMGLKQQFGYELDFDYSKIGEVCSLVEKYSSVGVQSHKPVVGSNVFSHESGIHVDGVLKDSENYEAFPPEIVGRERSIYFGKHSGVAGLKFLFGEIFDSEEYLKILMDIKKRSQEEKRSFSSDEIYSYYLNWKTSTAA